MMLKEIFSISVVALLLAAIAFAALEAWIEIRARQLVPGGELTIEVRTPTGRGASGGRWPGLC